MREEDLEKDGYKNWHSDCQVPSDAILIKWSYKEVCLVLLLSFEIGLGEIHEGHHQSSLHVEVLK
jgi:hypothetical protein